MTLRNKCCLLELVHDEGSFIDATRTLHYTLLISLNIKLCYSTMMSIVEDEQSARVTCLIMRLGQMNVHILYFEYIIIYLISSLKAPLLFSIL